MAPAIAAIGPLMAEITKGAQKLREQMATEVYTFAMNDNLDWVGKDNPEAEYKLKITQGMLIGAGVIGLAAWALYNRDKFWKNNIEKVTGAIGNITKGITGGLSGIQEGIGSAGAGLQQQIGSFGAWIQGK